MSAHDRLLWDERYRHWSDDAYPDPDPLLYRFAPPLREGDSASALDLAAGRGQNGLWLAGQGYVVDLVDVSRVGLLRARNEAARRDLSSVNFLQLDLDSAAFEPDSYDLICVFRFLSRALIPQIRAAIRSGGRVIYQTFNVRYRTQRPDISPEYLLNLGELAGYFGDWHILHNHEPDHISQLVAIKPGKVGYAVITTLYLTRHGQTDFNVNGIFQDHNGSVLTELGICQALWLAERLRDTHFDALYSSSSSRAIKTAEFLRGVRPLDIAISDALREIDVGDWKGRRHAEIEQLYPLEGYHFFHAAHLYVPLSGESFADVRDRAVPAINEIVRANAGKTVLVVTHSITLKTILNHFEGRAPDRFWEPPPIKPTSLSIVEIEDGVARIRLYADTSHYPEAP